MKHTEEPSYGAYWPSRQLIQSEKLLEASKEEKEPTGQLVQLDEPDASEYEPGLQITHVEAPGNTANLPSGQLIHRFESFEASIVENVPAGQALQLEEPATSEYEPEAQAIQSDIEFVNFIIPAE